MRDTYTTTVPQAPHGSMSYLKFCFSRIVWIKSRNNNNDNNNNNNHKNNSWEITNHIDSCPPNRITLLSYFHHLTPEDFTRKEETFWQEKDINKKWKKRGQDYTSWRKNYNMFPDRRIYCYDLSVARLKPSTGKQKVKQVEMTYLIH